MIFAKKEDNPVALPDLPEIQLNTRNNPIIENKLPELPHYNNISVSEVKEDPYSDSTIGMERSSFSEKKSYPEKNIPKISEVKTESSINKNNFKKDEETFVKIKKFENAMAYFDDIKKKVEEIKKDLEKSKKTMQEETAELEEWEKEMTLIKQNIENIDKSLFTEIKY
ncbi:hypothetical protein J4218_06470 [Candidatus Pacearchaeota archaeon]|nr:hypothetical protein [Candidatus Pacearchaeota archaeon]